MASSRRWSFGASSMSDVLRVELFAEDLAHEKLLMPLVTRLASNEQIELVCQVRSARGGHSKAIREFRLYQDLLLKRVIDTPTPDVLVVAIDTNCSTFSQARKQIADATRDEFRHMLVTACPDPHIERWYLADPDSFSSVVGYRPAPGPRKCQRGHYKRMLREAIQKGGHPSTLGGIEFAAELVGVMDLFRAGRSDASLKAFFDGFRETLRTSARSRSPE